MDTVTSLLGMNMDLTTSRVGVTSSTVTGAALKVPTVEPEMRTTTRLPGVNAKPGDGDGVAHTVAVAENE